MSLVMEKYLRTARFRVDGALAYSQTKSTKFDKHGTKWAQGLRGISAAMVCASHMLLTLDPECFSPADSTGQTKLLQRPYFRLGIQGTSWVAVFLIMLGFVNSLKALELRHKGDAAAALQTIARSWLKQLLRLALPAAAMTGIGCLTTNLRLQEYARYSQSRWLRVTTPNVSSGMIRMVVDWMQAVANTWVIQNSNPYDASQWALKYFGLAYLLSYSVLLLTMSFSPAKRGYALIFIALISMRWSDRFGDPYTGFTSILGIFFAELVFRPRLYTAIKRLSLLYTPFVFALGLFLMSYPPENPQRALWSLYMRLIEPKLVERESRDERFYCSVGAVLFFSGCLASPLVQHVLSVSPLEWLGSVSYSLYLIHGTVMRTVFAWLMFCGSEPITEATYDEAGNAQYVVVYPYPGPVRTGVSLALYVVTLAVATQAWTKRVEPVFARWSEIVQEFLCRE